MKNHSYISMQQDMPDQGQLQVTVLDSASNRPVENATVRISYTGVPDTVIEEIRTDSSGKTPMLELAAPPLEYSMKPVEQQPYAEYTVRISAEGFTPKEVAGTEVLPHSIARQGASLSRQQGSGEDYQRIVIGPHTLFGEYPPKNPEAEIKPINETGEIVLNKVVIPEYIVVHDGPIGDTSAQDYYVRYKDYIKNVASSEIYATWPRSTIVANVLAIMSFTLNRVYTEWYRNQGYDFTITSSTAFDHKWIYGRDIFEPISEVVDDIFDNYLSRPGVRQPILTQYCDGRRVSCPGWMTQWGSCSLGEQGYSAIEILRRFYGNSIYINTAEQISGIPISYPGEPLKVGSSGDKVRQLQQQLDAVATVYTAIPRVTPDGIYGSETEASVRAFQSVFGLPQTGVVDFATWYKISHIYVGISRIAELN